MGTPEMIDDGVSGRLVAPGSVDELADVLVHSCGDPDAARRLGVARVRRGAPIYLGPVVDRMAPVLDARPSGGEATHAHDIAALKALATAGPRRLLAAPFLAGCARIAG